MIENHTTEQMAIFEDVPTDSANYAINALAGTGKTYTLTALAELLHENDPNKSILSLCFSKADQLESNKRMPDDIESRTSHSFGRSVYVNMVDCNNPHVNGGKVNDIFFKHVRLVFQANVADFTRCVSIVKSNMLYSTLTGMKSDKCGRQLTQQRFNDIVHKHGLDIKPYDSVSAWGLVNEALHISYLWSYGKYNKHKLINWRTKKEVTTPCIDFDDMIYIPILYGTGFNKFDIILLDEAQDLAPIQHELVRRIMKKNSRIIIVGDPNQAIYGFRGADEQSFASLINEYDCTIMPLTLNFRCDQKIITEAQKIVPDIRGMEEKSMGIVYSCEQNDNWLNSLKGEVNTAILCRFNAPLFGVFYPLIKRGCSVNILGSDIGKGLAAILKKKTPNGDKKEVRKALVSWKIQSLNALESDSIDDPSHERHNALKATLIGDKFECINIVLVNEVNKDAAIKRLTTMFDSKTPKDITLSSIHKMKGREYSNVHIIQTTFPAIFLERMSEAQHQQEENLKYVSITRAKHKLVFITAED